ncbi:MarR family winged helix-turn-helix transcriptional regulator [Actinacidiphila glaucinigra]|uniref:MarR family winged helix-turn-helix transcriptional regulator n=1 Tax=Actinacidiphila glaucinigra TaxID=235986 RepID=UPI0035DC0ACB
METENGTRWLAADEQRSWRIHLDVGRLMTRQLSRDLEPFGLTCNTYEVLVSLTEAPEHRMRISALARATVQPKSRLSQQISRMEAAGLVRREVCESDLRGLYVVLTEEGWETMRTVAPHQVAAVRRHFIDLLRADDLAALDKALTPIVEHLRGKAWPG